nr:colicin E5-related ribonuclease [Cupriavidus plantarum]
MREVGQSKVRTVISQGAVGATTDNRSAAKSPDGLPRSDPGSVYGSKNRLRRSE